MKKNSSDWIAIARQVSINPFVKIPCPDCSEDFLQILIVPWKGEEQKVDVHLICNSCNSRNTITKEVEESYSTKLSNPVDQ